MEPADPLAHPLIVRPPASTSKELTTRKLLLVHLSMLIVQLGFSSNIFISKKSLSKHHYNQLVFALYRDVVSLVCLVPLSYIVERLHYSSVGDSEPLFVKASSAFAGQLLLLHGLSLATPTSYAYAVNFTPVFTYVITILFRVEVLEWWRRDGWFKILGMVLGIVGAITISSCNGPTPKMGRSGAEILPPQSAGQKPAFGLSPNQQAHSVSLVSATYRLIGGSFAICSLCSLTYGKIETARLDSLEKRSHQSEKNTERARA